jgi:2',3'-cyclic-nucleotide 2'-phosphodiesterase (5'-nucleotidase family)
MKINDQNMSYQQPFDAKSTGEKKPVESRPEISDSVKLKSSKAHAKKLDAAIVPPPSPEKSGKKVGKEEAVNLTIIHTNDLHGYVEEHPPQKEEQIVGGIARVAGKVRELRAENPEGVIVLDGGDIFDGGFYSKYTDGEIIGKTFKAIDYDAIALGNHDLGWGRPAFKTIADEIGTDFLAANVKDLSHDGSLDSLKPYKILEKKGLRIGVLGVTSRLAAVSGPDKGTIEVNDPVETVKSGLLAMKSKEHVDLVVLLSHRGYDDDVKLAQQLDGIQVIVGSHSHSAMRKPEKVGNTIIVQAGAEGDYVGELEIAFDRNKKTITSFDGRLIPMTAEVPPDPEVESIMSPYIEKFKPLREKVLGTVAEDLKMYDNNVESTNLTNLFIDAQMMDSDIALASMFSIRKGLEKGPITTYDLFNAYPYENELFQVSTKGSNVTGFLESALRDGYKGVYTLFSGLAYEYNPALVEGQRITSLTYKGKNYTRQEFADQPLKVSMDNYIQGKSYFKGSTIIKKYGRVFDILQDYLTEPSSLARLSSETRYKKVDSVPDPSLLADSQKKTGNGTEKLS